MEKEINYFGMAENDYLFLEKIVNQGLVYNAICYISQNICERYLKHIVDEFILDVDTFGVMRTHSIKVLAKFF
ncbi:MAG: hypothetical protein Q4B70_06230, partial [Lachnospiraceae bacterium]|nr:hypothetical protein [Lachnospiraceae bacterium]